MTGIDGVPWPPDPIRTARLVLRGSQARDRPAFVELLASPQVHTFLGGPQSRPQLERELPAAPERWPGSFVVERDGTMIGQVLLRRAMGHRRPAAAGRADLGYLFLPRAWGSGYAAEACAAALAWFDDVQPGEPVVLTTQSANVASMRLAAKLGFIEVERFRAWDAEQWLGQRPGGPRFTPVAGGKIGGMQSDRIPVGTRVVDAAGEDAGTVTAVQEAGTGVRPDLPAGIAEMLMGTGYLRINGSGALSNDTYADESHVAEVTPGEPGTVRLSVPRSELFRSES